MRAGQDLVFEAHGHEIIQLCHSAAVSSFTVISRQEVSQSWLAYLVHRAGAQAHDRGVCELVENLARRGATVELLWLEQLGDEIPRKHSFDNVL
jgi:hypothetical protein|eukprot:COSAG02_NODE_8731_length_2460_cov_4.432591_3_plen_94_part_00